LHRARGNDPKLVAQLVGVMRAYRPTVVHTRNWATYVEGALAATLARAPALVHGEHGTPSPGLWRHKWAYRLLAQRTQLVVTVSDALAEHYRTTYGYWAPTIRTIRNGVDTEKFSPTADRASAKAALGLAGLSPVIGSVGRLVPVKGYDVLLRAAALLVRQRPDARFLLIGDGPEKTNLQALARQLGLENHVHFAGEQADVVPFYRAMDLFVSSSHSEGISNVILEALACGVPVVGTEVGGTPEILRLAGAAGNLVKPNDPDALAQVITDCLADPQALEHRRIAARETICKHFSLNRMVENYEELYHEVAANHGSRRRLSRTGFFRRNRCASPA
jgi:glycosyltransferase involved in cell wall biosynthesis